VLLNKFEHLSYEEIAEVMQLTPSAVKSLLTRARANLRDVLEPYLQQGIKVE
jgi:RNA polymerase sigma-70 factor (ECF subfamily)